MSRKVIQVSSKYKAKDGTEKWKNSIVGSAFVYDNGDISLLIDPGISINNAEGVKITIKDPYDSSSAKPSGRSYAKGDNIPF